MLNSVVGIKLDATDLGFMGKVSDVELFKEGFALRKQSGFSDSSKRIGRSSGRAEKLQCSGTALVV